MRLGTLVAFAKKLGIEIVPGIEMPAHAQAILEAMPGLRCNGDIPNIWVCVLVMR